MPVTLSFNVNHFYSMTQHLVEGITFAKKLITKDILYHYTIAWLSRQTGLNEFDLKRGFKKTYGMELYAYLMKTRMERSIELLQETDKPIKDIYFICGYRHENNFIASFSRKHHQTPSCWRKEWQGGVGIAV
jgi:AraC family transcriptional regulator, transcriptional activator of the genes for pyochelin and ferripyochelin receptors